jgi:protein-tyrosine-phosphatase
MSPPTRERRVLFVCTHNAGRSIVAAALNARRPSGVPADSAAPSTGRLSSEDPLPTGTPWRLLDL